MIRTVIFDLGGVLHSVDWEVRFRHCNLSGERKERVRRATIASSDWLLLNEGMEEEAVFKKMAAGDPEMEPEIREFLKSFAGVVKARDYAREWVRVLKEAGLKVFILSNFSRRSAADNRRELEFLSETDGVVFSFEAGTIKPHKEIYDLLLCRYSLDPGECVFLDDRRDNLEAAKAQGIEGILFTSQMEAAAKLQELLSIELPYIYTKDSRKRSSDSESIL